MQAGRFLREDQGAVGDAVKVMRGSLVGVDADDAIPGWWFQFLHVYTYTYTLYIYII